MKTITPHLWFDTQAREAAEFYVSLLPGSRIKNVTTLSDTPSGDCDVVTFELAGQPFIAISAGPLFKFNPSVSFQIKCSSQEEVDSLWDQLSPGGKVLIPLGSYSFSPRYAWVEDKYGLSWQVMHVGANPSAQRITPALLFTGDVHGKAEEAINFYVSVFNGAPDRASAGNTKADVLARYGPGEEPDREGTVRYAQFSLRGQEFAAMDSARGHKFTFNEAICLLVACDTQEEIDYLWGKLSADPKSEQCGWLKDKYGLSWQIAPAILSELLSGGDKKRIQRTTQAFLKMKKLDIAALKQAAAGKDATSEMVPSGSPIG
ncbi:MAG: VOC family protein [Acidobacteriaceae bacterium]|nr:VOC family protein [Acidobacteriaceae bacterium]